MQVVLKNQPASVVVLMRNSSSGLGEAGLLFSGVTVDFRLSGASSFTSKTLTALNFTDLGGGFYEIDFAGQTPATAQIGGGANGTVTIYADEAYTGSGGNALTVNVTVPAGTAPLMVSQAGSVLTVALAVTAGVPTVAANTATLIAAAITALPNFTAAASGTGADEIAGTASVGFAGGLDGDFSAVGNTIVRANSASTDLTVVPILVSEVLPTTPTLTSTPATTLLFGSLYSAQGEALSESPIHVRVISTPLIQSGGAETYAVGSGSVTVTTDASGFFSVSLVTGAVVDVFIPSTNFRKIVRVPVLDSNLFYL